MRWRCSPPPLSSADRRTAPSASGRRRVCPFPLPQLRPSAPSAPALAAASALCTRSFCFNVAFTASICLATCMSRPESRDKHVDSHLGAGALQLGSWESVKNECRAFGMSLDVFCFRCAILRAAAPWLARNCTRFIFGLNMSDSAAH
eukprot:5499251-Pleurochrysis_carterae.AAC.1